jgi:uncharacterized membrane protein
MRMLAYGAPVDTHVGFIVENFCITVCQCRIFKTFPTRKENVTFGIVCIIVKKMYHYFDSKRKILETDVTKKIVT